MQNFVEFYVLHVIFLVVNANIVHDKKPTIFMKFQVRVYLFRVKKLKFII